MKKYKMYHIIWKAEHAKEEVLLKAYSETPDGDHKAKKALFQAWVGQYKIAFTAWSNYMKAVTKINGGAENADSEEW